MKERTSVAGVAVRTFSRRPPQQELLVARRLPGGDLGGKWEFPGGKVEEGESDEEALIREFNEELSTPIEVLSFIGETDFVHGDIHFTLRFYWIKLLSENIILSAHSQWRWVSMDNIISLDFADSDRKLFPAIKKDLKKKDLEKKDLEKKDLEKKDLDQRLPTNILR